MKVSGQSMFKKPDTSGRISASYVQEIILPQVNKLAGNLDTIMNFRKDSTGVNAQARENLTTLFASINAQLSPESVNENQSDTGNSPGF